MIVPSASTWLALAVVLALMYVPVGILILPFVIKRRRP